MERLLEKNLSSMSNDENDSPITYQCLKDLEPSERHMEDIGSSKLWHVVSTAAENINFVTAVAEICSERKFDGFNGNEKELLEQHAIISEEVVQRLCNLSQFEELNIRQEWQFKMSLREVIALVATTTKTRLKKIIEKANILHGRNRMKHVANAAMKQLLKGGHQPKKAHSLVVHMDEFLKITKEKLLTSEEEEESRLEYLKNILSRARKSHDHIISLENQLQEAIKDKDRTLSLLDASLKQIVAENMTQKSNASTDQDNHWSKTSRIVSRIGEAHRSASVALRQDIYALHKTLESNRGLHFEKETNLRKECYKIETEVHNLVTKYDNDMEEYQKQIDELLELQAFNKPNLMKLEEKFAILNTTYQAIIDERERRQDAIDRQLARVRVNFLAAIKIQSLWKGYKARKLQKKKLAAERRKRKKKAKGKKE